MGKPRCSDEEFVRLFQTLGPIQTAKHLGVAPSNVFRRKDCLQKSSGELILGPKSQKTASYEKRIPIDLKDGVIIVGSDSHYWPDLISTAHRAFIKLIGELKPQVVILNGDVFDGAGISRHPPLGWVHTPSVRDELYAVEERLTEIEEVSKDAKLFWTMGNHDARLEMKLAAQVPEFKGVEGMTLGDRFPKWTLGISLWVNDDVVIKHRYKGGTHAAHNNTAGSGRSICTGHMHKLCVTPYSDYNGNRFGVDTGTLAEIYGDQFAYTEDAPVNWRSGFVVLTFSGGKLLWPEICHVLDEKHVEFRGKVIEV